MAHILAGCGALAQTKYLRRHNAALKIVIEARFEDKENKEILLLEMTCPLIENRDNKEEEKTQKYAPLRWELRNPGYKISK